MAIVTPYPVGTVTDPFGTCEACVITDPYANTTTDPYTDCDTGCSTDPANPYSLGAGWSYDSAWTPITSSFNPTDVGTRWLTVYKDKLYFLLGSYNELYECNPLNGAIISVAASVGSGSYTLWSIETGALAGLYCCRKNTDSSHALCKWNEVDAWVQYPLYRHAMYSSPVTLNNLIYVGAFKFNVGVLLSWNGIDFSTVIYGAGTPNAYYIPYYMWVVDGTIYAVCIHNQVGHEDYTCLVVAIWSSGNAWTVISDKLTGYQLYYTYAVWHNGTIYLGYRQAIFNSVVMPIRKLNSDGSWTDLPRSFECYSMVSHADGRLYILSGVADLWYYDADDSGPTQLIDMTSDFANDWRMAHYNNDLYCLYDPVTVFSHYIGKLGISQTGYAITDPYDCESLCTDPAYTT